MNIKELNLWEKISLISEGTGALSKDGNVGSGSFAYKAITIENVVKNVGAQMHKYGVVIYPIDQKVNFYNEDVVNNKGQEVKNRVVECEITYEVVNIHKPEEKIKVVGFASSCDSVDKHSGKAQTYAYKNMLIKLFNLPIGDDLDKQHSNDYDKNNGFTSYKTDKKINNNQVKLLWYKADEANLTKEQVLSGIKRDYNLDKVEDLSNSQLQILLERFNNRKEQLQQQQQIL